MARGVPLAYAGDGGGAVAAAAGGVESTHRLNPLAETVQGADPAQDYTIFLIVGGIVLVIGVATIIVVVKKRVKKS